jgi:hypothetical protein
MDVSTQQSHRTHVSSSLGFQQVDESFQFFGKATPRFHRWIGRECLNDPTLQRGLEHHFPMIVVVVTTSIELRPRWSWSRRSLMKKTWWWRNEVASFFLSLRQAKHTCRRRKWNEMSVLLCTFAALCFVSLPRHLRRTRGSFRVRSSSASTDDQTSGFSFLCGSRNPVSVVPRR